MKQLVINEETARVIMSERKAGKTILELSLKYDISTTSVSRICKSQQAKAVYRNVADTERDKKIIVMRKNNMSIAIIAEKLKISTATVHRALQYERNVPLSPREKAKLASNQEAMQELEEIKAFVTVGSNICIKEDKHRMEVKVQGVTPNYFYGKTQNGYTVSFNWIAVQCRDVKIERGIEL